MSINIKNPLTILGGGGSPLTEIVLPNDMATAYDLWQYINTKTGLDTFIAFIVDQNYTDKHYYNERQKTTIFISCFAPVEGIWESNRKIQFISSYYGDGAQTSTSGRTLTNVKQGEHWYVYPIVNE